jgi:osmotically-inducible protein OsmY
VTARDGTRKGEDEGTVLLEGKVPSFSHQRLAGVLAWWVPGRQNVLNCLEAVPPEEDNDDEVTDAVRLVLEKDPFVNAGQIRISTQKLHGDAGRVGVQRSG